jgi:hypothetical protein
MRRASLMCELPIQSIKNTFLFLLFNDVKVCLRRKKKQYGELFLWSHDLPLPTEPVL